MKKMIKSLQSNVIIVVFFSVIIVSLGHAMEQQKIIATPTPTVNPVPSLRFKAAYSVAQNILSYLAQPDLVNKMMQQLPVELKDYVLLLVQARLDIITALWSAVTYYPYYSLDIINDLLKAVTICAINTPANSSSIHHGHTLLTQAILKQSPDLVTLLLDHGANPNQPSMEGLKDTYPLTWAVLHSTNEIVTILLSYGANSNQKDHTTGATPLLFNILLNPAPFEKTKLLLEQGADVNLKDNRHKTTPLIIAAYKNYIDVIKLLLAYNADVDDQDAEGNTALSRAIEKSNVAVVQLLLNHGAKVTTQQGPLLLLALYIGNVEVVKILLEHIIKTFSPYDRKNIINYSGGHHNTALLMAITKKFPEIVALLLENGADVNQANNNGQTPLILAAKLGLTEIIRLLLNQPRIEINTTDSNGFTALMYATKGNFPEIVDLLLDREAVVESEAHEEN